MKTNTEAYNPQQVLTVILAGGKGTRLQTETDHRAKVLREINGKPMLSYVLRETDFSNPDSVVLVTGYRHEEVEWAFPGYRYALQEPQLGTGHAVQCALPYIRGFRGTVLVGYGDMPLLKKETYLALLETHFQSGADCTILTGTTDRPLAYGRILRKPDGAFLRVVEDRDCTPEQKTIRELNVGIYAFRAEPLTEALGRLKNDNAQKEYYLTDVPVIIRDELGGKISVCSRNLGEQILGINTQRELDEAAEILK